MNDRTKMPITRPSITHKVTISEEDIYFTIGFCNDWKPKEVFITIGKEGSSLGGAYDAIGIMLSLLMQSGWTVEELAAKFEYTRCEPSGFTQNKEIPNAHSILDYLMKYLKSPLFLAAIEKRKKDEHSTGSI